GWRVGFTPWIAAYAMSVGVPGHESLSSCHVSHAEALRKALDMRLDVLDADGRLEWGFSHEPGKVLIENQTALPIAAERYLIHTGDISWAQRRFFDLERAVGIVTQNARQNSGLIGWTSLSEKVCANWYFDGIRAGGSLAYHNAFYYASLLAMASIAGALGRHERQNDYTDQAEVVRQRFNELFWDDNACGTNQAAYSDWVDPHGTRHSYFMSLVQYPAIVFGLATPERARAILDTADRRLAVLTEKYGYTGEATLDCLWPVPQELCAGCAAAGWGYYQNGGMLLSWTYWEIVARARCGDKEGAYRRLRAFTQHAAKTNWYEGENSFTREGVPFGWAGEPYLADQVIVPAAIVHGLLGVTQHWDKLDVQPALPVAWPHAEVLLLHRGEHFRVAINGQNVSITPAKERHGGEPRGQCLT
ncbi:MAG: hypothetical protein IT440_06275, partial [Phycisphaeraceae bacterium]|nr:hypothetical protein [Phycisphaeraceae bacterium]